MYADDPPLLGRICFDGKAAVGKLTCESQGVFSDYGRNNLNTR
jgi:hypothetical protein